MESARAGKGCADALKRKDKHQLKQRVRFAKEVH